MKNFKAIFLFLILAFGCLFGLLGGVSYAVSNGSWFIAAGIVALGYMAYPKACEIFDNMFKD